MSLLLKIKELKSDIGTTSEQSLQYFRQRVLFYLLSSTMIFGFIAYFPSVYFAYKHNLYTIIVIDTLAIASLIFLFFNKALNYHQKVIGILIICYSLGIWLLVVAGPMGSGFLWLFMFAVMAGVLLGIKPTFVAIALNTLSTILLGFMVYHHQLSWTQSISDPFAMWIINGVNFLCLNSIVSISIAILLKKLNEIFNKEKKNSSDLKNEIKARILAEKENERLAKQIMQKQKMEAMGTLAGGIAHDFNNILSAILGNAELALMDIKKDNPTYKNLENICTASDRAKDIVRQILTFSRQTGSEKAVCSMKALVRDCTKLFKVSIPSNIEFSCSIQTDQETIFADQTQIYQVIMNLCTNAIHAIKANQGKILVSIKKKAITSDDDMGLILDPGDYFELNIEDTGCGIEQDKIAKIFEPYFTTKEVGKGTGMGLAIAHGIIKDHGGEIMVSSKPDIGTRFDIYLPVYKSAHINTIPDSIFEYKGKEKILYVDDEEDLLRINKQYLRRLGYTVDCQSDPVCALKTFSLDPGNFDLVITDQKMPHMTGDLLINEIKKIRPDIPVILCSGVADTAQSSELDEILIKPVKNVKLSQTIRKVLDKTNNYKIRQTHVNIPNV